MHDSPYNGAHAHVHVALLHVHFMMFILSLCVRGQPVVQQSQIGRPNEECGQSSGIYHVLYKQYYVHAAV